MWVFNADVTAYPRIALPLFSHRCLVAPVLSLGTPCALGGVPLSPSMISVCREQNCPQQRFLAVRTFFIHSRTFLSLQRGPWAWYEMGRGFQNLWPYIMYLSFFFCFYFWLLSIYEFIFLLDFLFYLSFFMTTMEKNPRAPTVHIHLD